MEESKAKKVTVEIINIDEQIQKAEHLNALIKEAKSLAEELASYEYKYVIND